MQDGLILYRLLLQDMIKYSRYTAITRVDGSRQDQVLKPHQMDENLVAELFHCRTRKVQRSVLSYHITSIQQPESCSQEPKASMGNSQSHVYVVVVVFHVRILLIETIASLAA